MFVMPAHQTCVLTNASFCWIFLFEKKNLCLLISAPEEHFLGSSSNFDCPSPSSQLLSTSLCLVSNGL